MGVSGKADCLSAIHASTIVTSIENKPHAHRRMAMTQENTSLFGKTFDQQVFAANGSMEGRNISPNQMISGSIVLEPLGSGIRVTARDLDHRIHARRRVGNKLVLQVVMHILKLLGICPHSVSKRPLTQILKVIVLVYSL